MRSFDFEITRMISDQIALHSVQLPLLSDPVIKFSSILKKVNVKPRKNASSVCYCVFN